MTTDFPNEDLLLAFGVDAVFIDADNVSTPVKAKIDASDQPSNTFDTQVENRTIEASVLESDVGEVDNRCRLVFNGITYKILDVKFDGTGMVLLTLGLD